MVTMVVHHPTILSSHGVDENRHQDQRALLSQLGRTDVIVDLARWAGVNGSHEGFACDMTSSKYIFLGSLGLHMYYIQLVCTHTYMYIYIYTQYPQKYPQLQPTVPCGPSFFRSQFGCYVAKSLLQDERVNGQEALNRIQVGCEKECWGGKANGETVGGFHGISISI